MRRINFFLIAIFLFIICSGTSANPQKKQNTLRILSYNIHHGEGTDGKIDLKRIAEVISSQNPHLVALQEVDKNCKRSGNQDIAAKLGELLRMQHKFGKSMDFRGGEYGMAILSKLPIVDVICHPLPEGAEPRCALEVMVKMDGFHRPISFVSIHNDWKSEQIRVEQIQALLKIMHKRGNPVILAGDFNSKRTEMSLKLLEEAHWKILTNKEEKTFPSDNPEVEIDFFVIKNFPEISLKQNVIDEKVVSDHRPIYAEIIFLNNIKTKVNCF